ncbi:uncharacterized mitochondrial protein-like protein [Tanacetum coccineum]
MISLGLSLSKSFLEVGTDWRVLVNSSSSGSISLILACYAPFPFLGGLSQLIGFYIKPSDSHMFLLRFMGLAPKNSTILLNTSTSLKGLISASLAIFHSSVSSNSPMLSFLKRYNGIMFTQDPKSAKVSKGLESPSLQELHYTLEHELGLREPEWFLSLEHDLTALIKLRGWGERWGSPVGYERADKTKAMDLAFSFGFLTVLLGSAPVIRSVMAIKTVLILLVDSLTMAGVDIDTLTMEQYLALSRENQAPGVVKPEIGGNVNFKIKSQFMRELREDTFSGNKNEDAHDHIDRVLNIVGLFNISVVSKDAVMLPVFPLTLTEAAKRWVDRLAPGTINTWDLLITTLLTVGFSSRNIMDGIDIEYLTIKQYLELTQENYAPIIAKADVPTKYRDHLSPRHKSPDPPLDAKTNPYSQASLSPIHPKITKTPSKHTRENEVIKEREHSDQGLVDIFNINAIADLGASVNILSKSILEELSLADQKNANIIVEMADKTRCVSQGIIENVLVKIDKFSFTSDFVIIDTKGSSNKTLILGRPFLVNIRDEINISTREVSLGIEENRLGGQTREKTITEEQEDPKKCGEAKIRAIIGAMINKLPEEWISGVSRVMDDLEGIIDYPEPTLYDRFIDHNDEAYKQRRNKLLGMPYTEPLPIVKEEAEITRYNLGAGEVFTKTEILNIEGFPIIAPNIIDMRAEIINDRNGSSEDLSNTKRRHWCKPIYQWKEDMCTKWASCNPHFDECDGGDNPRENREYWESSNDDKRTYLEWENLSFDN